MFGGKGLKLSAELLEKVKLAADLAGASSVDEFVAKVLETECDRVLSQVKRGNLSEKEVEDIANKLKGLGYLE